MNKSSSVVEKLRGSMDFYVGLSRLCINFATMLLIKTGEDKMYYAVMICVFVLAAIPAAVCYMYDDCIISPAVKLTCKSMMLILIIYVGFNISMMHTSIINAVFIVYEMILIVLVIKGYCS